jgi:preprotein translocase subunit SecG
MLLALWYHNILATLFGLLAVVLMGIILLQRGKGVGLSGAFGGAGGHTAFGAKTGDVLTWATIIAAVALLAFAVVLNYVFRPLAAPGAATPAATVTPTVPTEGSTGGEPVRIPAKTVPNPGAGEPVRIPAQPAPKPETDKPAGGGEAPAFTQAVAEWPAPLREWRQEIFGVEAG